MNRTKLMNPVVDIHSSVPPVANLSDALSKLGFKNQTMHARMRPVSDFPLYGPAYTVHCYPGATWALEEAIEKACPGDILVVDGEGYTNAVLMGGLMSLRAHTRGIKGAVIDGAVRDVEEIRQLAFPVYATAVVPRGGVHAQVGKWGHPVSCAGVVVHPGDWVVADPDGVVVIPQDSLQEVLKTARRIEEKETSMASSLKTGMTLAEAVAYYEQQI